MGRACEHFELSRRLDRALTVCQASVRPLSDDIAVRTVRTVRLSVDSLLDCQATVQARVKVLKRSELPCDRLK